MYEQLKFTPENISSLGEDDVFVFGSNLAGDHSGGAARIAREKFGAIMGQGVGLQGQSYAIPTTQGGVESIRRYVDEFINFASTNFAKRFLVTKIGCGNAGFKVADIAPLFTEAIKLNNVKLPREFYEVLADDKLADSYLPNWRKHYTTYDMTLDLLLSANRKYKYSESDKEAAIATLRQLVGYRGRTHHNPLIDELFQFYPKDETLPTKENLDDYILMVAASIRPESLLYVPYYRYRIRLCYEVIKEMLVVADFYRTDRAKGWAIPGDFFYTFFSFMTGRWTCGDCSYLDDNIRQAFPVIEKALRDNWLSLLDENGMLSDTQIKMLFAKPDLWMEWHKLCEHELALYRTIMPLLRYECWDRNGNYHNSIDGFYYPRTNFSLPVFSHEKGRLHFPNFELKKAFIQSLTKSESLF